MNKALCTLMCYAIGMVASSLVAIGADVSTVPAINFNNENLWGSIPEYGLNDEGKPRSDNSYWYFSGLEDNHSCINAYTTYGVPGPYDRFDAETNPRPAYMTEAAANTGLMKVEVGTSILERTFTPVPSAEGPRRDNCVDVPDGGLCIDMLVKYDTGFMTLPKAELYRDAGVKVGFGMLTGDNAETGKFFVVAGCYRGETYAVTNYMTDISLTTSQWYRVTARMFSNAATASGESLPAFAVYLDGALVSCPDAASYDDVMGEKAAAIFKGSELYQQRALFPTMQTADGARYADKAYSVAFQGLGYVDEIGVSTNVLARATNMVDMVIVCDDTMLTQLVYTASVDGKPYTNGTITAGFNGFTIPAKVGAVVDVVPYVKESVALAESFTLGGNLTVVDSCVGYTVYFKDADRFEESGRVTATFTAANAYFQTEGRSYTLFSDAVAAADEGGTVRVVQDVTLDKRARMGNGQAWIKPTQSIVLDLGGKTIKGEHFDQEAAIYNQGLLQIIDSVGGGMIEAPGTVIETEISTNFAVHVNNHTAQLTMGDKASQIFKVRGRVKCTKGELIIRTGEYLTPADEPQPETKFYLTDYVDREGLYEVDPTPIQDPSDGWYWSVRYNNRLVVQFETEHGTVTPRRVLVDKGDTVSEPQLDAPGYVAGGWYNGDVRYDFAQTVESDLTLTASLTRVEYTVTNDWFETDFPTNYTVETPSTKLRIPARTHFRFNGWQDKTSGNYVTNIGAGACFVGTENVVTGNLDLVAQWQSEVLTWKNTGEGLAESNGTYSGEWPFTIPATTSLPFGMKIKVREIAFCVVNPTQYGRTASYLAVKADDGASVYVSSPRAEIATDPTTGQYINYERLSNGRVKVSYRFDADPDNLPTIKVGVQNTVYFCDGVGTLGSGFLRLAHTTDPANAIIGNCAEPPSSPRIEYVEYCPVYEITGEVEP